MGGIFTERGIDFMTAEEYRALLDVDFNNVKIEDLTDIRKIKIDIELSTKGEYNNLYMYDDYIVEEIFPLNTNSINNLTNKR